MSMITARDVNAASNEPAFVKMMREHGLDGIVLIPRPQYEALMAAKEALPPLQSSGIWGSAMSWLVAGAEAAGVKATGIKVAKDFVRIQCRAEEALAALRAAGIETGEGK